MKMEPSEIELNDRLMTVVLGEIKTKNSLFLIVFLIQDVNTKKDRF